MATLYLHIGTPKTGTTSIQHLMEDNIELLKEHNICYPIFDFTFKGIPARRNAHFLVAEKSSYYEQGMQRLEDCARQYERIFLTSESLWSPGRVDDPRDIWSRLKKELDARNLQIRIIVYLRRQDQMIHSLYAQKVKHRDMHISFEKFLDDSLHSPSPYPLDYCAYLDRLADIFGRDSLVIRIFEKNQFQGPEGTLYSDFLDIFGLSLSDGFVTKQQYYNLKMTSENLELKRILNILPEYSGEEHQIVKAMRAIQLAGPDYPYSTDDFSYFTPQMRRQVLDQFAKSNQELARKYLHRADGLLFTEPVHDAPQPGSDGKRFLCNMIVVYAKAIKALEGEKKELEKQNKKLDRRVRKLEKRVDELAKYSPLYRLRQFAKK